MTELEARRVGLLRAFEAPITAPWTDADRLWASEQARRQVGEQATRDAFVVARASAGLGRLAQRDPALGTRLAAAERFGDLPRWLTASVVLATLGLGLAADAVGSAGRIHLLAPPLVALLLWNLGVYAVLVLAGPWSWWLSRQRARVLGRPSSTSAATRLLVPERHTGPLRSAWQRALARTTSLASLGLRRWDAVSGGEAIARALTSTWPIGSRLWSARTAYLLHLGAAALAIGAIGSLYARGLAFEYRAGWDSTFLSPDQALALVSTLLGPASALTGIALPDATAFAALRLSVGPGENAARWIHLWSATLSGAIVLPRLVLAFSALRQARRGARNLSLPWSDPYLQRLANLTGGGAVHLRVLPYAHQPGPMAHETLAAALRRTWGPRATLSLLGSVDEGHEDALLSRGATGREGSQAEAAGPTWTLPLMALSATPERETHGHFLQAIEALRGPAQPKLLLINEAGFAARLAAADAESRKRHRRAAWRQLASDFDHTVAFVDLSATSPAPSSNSTRDTDDDELAAALRTG